MPSCFSPCDLGETEAEVLYFSRKKSADVKRANARGKANPPGHANESELLRAIRHLHFVGVVSLEIAAGVVFPPG